jgi:hypothetical protein
VSEELAPGQGSVCSTSLVDRPVASEGNDGVDAGVDVVDPPEERLDHLDRRDLDPTDEVCRIDGAVHPDVFHDHWQSMVAPLGQDRLVRDDGSYCVAVLV